MLSNFDLINGSSVPSGRHSKQSTAKDMKLLLKQLHEDTDVFAEIPGRYPTKFLAVDKITQWMGEKLQKLITFQQTTLDQ